MGNRAPSGRTAQRRRRGDPRGQGRGHRRGNGTDHRRRSAHPRRNDADRRSAALFRRTRASRQGEAAGPHVVRSARGNGLLRRRARPLLFADGAFHRLPPPLQALETGAGDRAALPGRAEPRRTARIPAFAQAFHGFSRLRRLDAQTPRRQSGGDLRGGGARRRQGTDPHVRSASRPEGRRGDAGFSERPRAPRDHHCRPVGIRQDDDVAQAAHPAGSGRQAPRGDLAGRLLRGPRQVSAGRGRQARLRGGRGGGHRTITSTRCWREKRCGCRASTFTRDAAWPEPN